MNFHHASARRYFAVLFLWLVGIAQTTAQPLLIDDFSTDQALIFAIGAGSTASSFASGGMLGGERDLEVAVSAGAVSSGEVTGGALNFSVSAATTGAGILAWDGADGLPASTDLDPVGLGGVDLTSGGALDSIALTILSADTTGSLTFTVYTDAANFSNSTVPIGPIVTATDFIVPFASFTVAAGTGADFSNVGAVVLTINGFELDIRVDTIQAVSALTVTKTDALLIDNDFDGFASPGDTIRYTVVIQNPDDAFDALVTGVMYDSNSPADANLVVGSVTTTSGTVTTGNTAGDTAVQVDIGTQPDNTSTIITYDVLIDFPLAPGVTSLTCQGTVTRDGLTGGLVTDDPDDPTSNTDPTLTPITQANIGDFIWNDLNGDGVQDGGEPGLSGVTVYLDLNSNGSLDGGEPSDVSDGAGAYDITGLPAGSYSVRIDPATVPTGFVLTTANIPQAVNLASGEDFNTADFGYQQQDASIGVFIWNDLNGNGVQDGGELGLDNVTLDLYRDSNGDGQLDAGDILITTETTTGGGIYIFTGLTAGDYILDVTDTADVLADLVLISGVNPLAITGLAAGQMLTTANFGYVWIGPAVPAGPAAIPTLSEWGIVLLCMLLLLILIKQRSYRRDV